MGSYFGTTGMWYKNGTFYELKTTHVEFFLQNPEKLGFTQEEKERLCIEHGFRLMPKHVPNSLRRGVIFFLK